MGRGFVCWLTFRGGTIEGWIEVGGMDDEITGSPADVTVEV